MGSQMDPLALKRDYERAQLQFITLELDLALTFCQIAANSHDRDKILRNIGHAEDACRAANRFLAGAYIDDDKKDEIERRVEELRIQLEQLYANG